jgi:cell fate (sporulation/competence/biofilm development) regulator YlbF (YheA/YmcA/DUF963 family)
METTIDQTPILRKTKELCQTLLDQPNIQSIRERIDTFMRDDKTRDAYDGLVKRGQALQEKQQNAQQLTGEEISQFEEQRDALLKNPVAVGFLEAQEEMHQVQKSIQRYVTRTLELGRLPTSEEIENHSCGHGGCGCGH